MRSAVAAFIALALVPAASASVGSELVRSDAAVRAAAGRWDGRGAVPRELLRALLASQRAELRLTPSTVPALPPRLAAQVRDDVIARAELVRLTPPRSLSAFRPGPARPAAELREDLHANGASRDLRRALYRYNPSQAYVDAVLRYARQIRAGYLAYYARHLFVRTPTGLRRLSATKATLIVQRRKLILDAPAYRLSLDRRTGAILDLLDKGAGAHLLGQIGCVWGANASGDDTAYGGCSDQMGYRWNRATSTLTLTYTGDIGAVVTLAAQPRFVDFRITLTNTLPKPLERVQFPADLVGRTTAVEAGYAPNYLPGIRLAPAFFSRIGNAVFTYPSRWGIADFLALDIAGGHVAVETVNPPPSPIAPVELGFRHWGSGGCSDQTSA